MWILNAGLVAAFNRAAFLALATVASVVLFVRETGRWMMLAFVSIAMAVLLFTVNPAVDLGLPRDISVAQLTQNVLSLFGSEGGDVNEATKSWRSDWWGTIVEYTIHGQYAATGKGFGINLADADGFQVLADRSLRAPTASTSRFLQELGFQVSRCGFSCR
jgi:hypothetical protein